MIEKIRGKIEDHISRILEKDNISAEDFSVLMQYLGKLEFEKGQADQGKRIEALASLFGGA